MPFPSFLSSRAPSFSLATVLVEKIGKHKCHHHHNLFWISGRSCRRRNWRRGTSHAPACGSQERERESGIMICFLLAFNGLQSQDSGTFQMFISMQRKLLGYSVWITGGRKICLIDLIFLTSGAFEAAIFP